ncbi:hypothetical protein RUA4292_03186 [Ruegeria atlantica]|uniref:Uncharacterized protein n=1 Tax=Ruegeria atlantica TaxID=81569 RepID=A0A0P1EFS6_9RHOB|nr:hypothetical protein RUA4292_03186 [Ruegeria atlantica]
MQRAANDYSEPKVPNAARSTNGSKAQEAGFAKFERLFKSGLSVNDS